MLKRILALILTLTLATGLLQVVALAWTPPLNDFLYAVPNGSGTTDMAFIIESRPTATENGKAYIYAEYEKTAIDPATTGPITIPATVTHSGEIYDVVSISHAAFIDCINITSVSIPSTVTQISDSAFEGCLSLESVIFDPDIKIEQLPSSVFSYCDKLKNITIPNSVKIINSSAFHSCKALESITIPDSVTSIDSSAFLFCNKLKTVNFGEDSQLKTLSEGTFSQCYSLTSLEIPKGVSKFNDRTIDRCMNLSSITFKNSEIEFTPNSFGLRSVPPSLSNGVKDIYFTGDFSPNIKASQLIIALENALLIDGDTPTIHYNGNWKQGYIDAFIKAFTDAGFPKEKIVGTVNAQSSSKTSAVAVGAWYMGTLKGAVTYTHIVDVADTTTIIEGGSTTIAVTGVGPTGIIVKLDPAVLSGLQSLSIESSIADLTLTEAQISRLVTAADGDVIHITIKGTADGVSITATAGTQTIVL